MKTAWLSKAKPPFVCSSRVHQNGDTYPIHRGTFISALEQVMPLIPRQRAARLVFGNAGFEEILFLLEVDHFRHPWERIRCSLI